MANERILVVDDSAAIREFIAYAVLANNGYDVLTAANGKEGLILARDLQPDLIIADHLMPEMTGLEMLAAIREEELNIPVILMTAEGSEALAVRALRAAVYDYLIKPVDAATLLDSVRESLKRHWTSQIKERIPSHLLEANRRLERRLRELNALVAIGKSVTAMLDIQQVLNHLVEAAVNVTNTEEGSLLLVDEITGELYVRAARNFDQKIVHTLRLKVNDSIAGQVVQTGQPVVVSGEDQTKIKTQYLVKGVVYVPLRARNKVIGVLSVDNRFEARNFDSHDVQILTILADFASIALENARLYNESVKERNTLDAILRDTDDHVIVVDTEDNVLFCNPTACTTFNVTMPDFVGRPLEYVIRNSEVLALFSKEAVSGRGRRSEITLGADRVLQAQLTIIEGIGRACVMQDISHLKLLDKAKSDFVATVAHDLRSPLTAVLGYSELMQRAGPLNEQQTKFMEQIGTSVHSITQLITELLELSRIEAGYSVDLEPVDIAQVTRKATDTLTGSITQKGHTLLVNIPDGLPRVLGNPLRLQQVVANLLSNAIKYTPDNGQLEIALWSDQDVVILKVADNGIGISPDDQPYIFDKFYRTERAVNDFEGTGLGLSIVKGIIDQHQGRIWLESKENEGSTFFVMLPTAQMAANNPNTNPNVNRAKASA